MTEISFCCPGCHSSLAEGDASLTCRRCEAQYPLIDGVPVFAARDAFYEGRWAEPDRSCGSLRNWLIKKQRFFLHSLRGKRGALLDLGCGGGWQGFAQTGMAVGVDLSLGSLKAARSLYSKVALAELAALPFPDETFDYVVSSDVLGHVETAKKDVVIAEIARVLRRGGRTLHYIEADSSDPLTRFEKRYPELYRRYIVEPEGHIGVEAPSQTTERFRRVGFRPVREVPSYKLLLYVNRIVQYFDNEYSRKARGIGLLVMFCKALMAVKPLELGANVAISLILEVTDRVLPAEWANGLMVEYER